MECQICSKETEVGGWVYEIGFVCEECLEQADDKTGHCSMCCQLTGNCDESC